LFYCPDIKIDETILQVSGNNNLVTDATGVNSDDENSHDADTEILSDGNTICIY